MKIMVVDILGFTLPYDLKLCESLCYKKDNKVVLAASIPRLFLSEDSLKNFEFEIIKLPDVFKIYKRNFFNLVFKILNYFFKYLILTINIYKFDPDIVHIQWVVFPLLDFFFLLLIKIRYPLILTLHDSVPFNNSPSLKLQKLGYYKVLGIFDSIIVHTKYSQKNLALKTPKILDKMHVIPHGFLEEIKINNNEKSIMKSSKKIILFWGTIKQYKGIDVLIKAYSLLDDDLKKDTILYIVGKPYMQMSDIFKLVESLSLQENVKFILDFISEEDLEKIINEAYVIVLPYRHIDASGVFMKSIVYLKPILASNIGLFREFLGDLEKYLLFEPDDVEGLAKKLRVILSDKEVYLNILKVISYKVKNYPTWREIADLTVDVYNLFIKRSPHVNC